jgi:hypothetical protein
LKCIALCINNKLQKYESLLHGARLCSVLVMGA